MTRSPVPRSTRAATTTGGPPGARCPSPGAAPAHVLRFGAQVKAKGVEPGSRDIGQTVNYITKYVTKNAAECHAVTTDAQRDHIDRLWRELRVTPCSDRCANWLLYGIAP